ncbi:long-chain-fatty-acid--CoA ligase [uncultured Sphingomonas sp.]|uniref:long-chain-fatty-acid--CoA ligase n=1 Tax=uncultured Sphingomonas sp. TaxID=158754 RepID=UPI0026344913|nr:long-chain-fatty-acid--CoA ligase [uncultured Sphingomonas sp.]
MTNAPLPRTFGDALRHHAATRPDGVALRHNGRVTSYAAFDAHADQVANAMIAMGLKKGDRIAYLGKNSDHAIELALGAARAGVVFVPIIWRLAPPEIAYILEDSGAAALFVEPAFAAIGEAAAQHGLAVIAMDDAGYVALRDGAPATPPPVSVSEEDIVLQLYTSGTTGKPKGVMLSHANGIRQRANQIAAGIDWLLSEPGDTTIIAMPYGHIGGVGVVLGAINNGQELIVHAEYDPGAVIDAIAAHRVKRLFLVPAAIGIMLQHPKAADADFSSIETLSYGASPIPLPLLKQAVERIGCGFVQVYGMTETWGGVVALPPEDHRPDREHKMTAAGKALAGVELKIIDADGNALPPGAIGEVAIRSPNNTTGYWGKPEETARALIGDGWLRTGDAGLLDEEGYLFIQDRIKDMIITGAENVYPAEVESAIYGHPAVADVAVIGIPDARWGEAVKAIVVLKPGEPADADAIIAHARARIAGFKCPKSVDFIAALPRNPSGKILRRELREPFWAGHDRRVN